jgi:excinuclease ABC subunit C
MKADLQRKIEELPACPGVYTFKDARGKVIYVGKAKSLRSRVRAYFRRGEAPAPKTAALVERTADVDIIVTRSEVEALILESNLIKHFKPRYNVSLKDDKRYPYIKVTVKEPYPTFRATRNVVKDGSRYFGPYTDAKAMRRTLRLLREIFPVRMCKRNLPLSRPDRGCLNYQIGRCMGPCRGDVDRDAYRSMIDRVCQYLSGRMSDLVRNLRRRMEEEAEGYRFEEAARLRDILQALEKVSQRQTVVFPDARDRDVVAVRSAEGKAVGVVLKVREGKLVGKETYRLAPGGEPGAEELVTAFLQQYLTVTASIPDEIVTESRPKGRAILERWLGGETGGPVRIVTPRSGKARDLARTAAANAGLLLHESSDAAPTETRTVAAVRELQRWLGLREAPAAVAAFDISTTQGSYPVGSRVFFRNGRPVKSLYRHYSIRSVSGQDDFAMMEEALKRAWGHVVTGSEERPDLVLIDGGKGQVSSALAGIVGSGESEVPPVVGIAKRLDEVYVPGRSEPVQIPRTSPALRMLQRIRDEAHRFALSYHRKLRSARGMRSVLESVRGIGPVLSRRLLKEFGSLDRIRRADESALAEVRGMNADKAGAVLTALRQDGRLDDPEVDQNNSSTA